MSAVSKRYFSSTNFENNEKEDQKKSSINKPKKFDRKKDLELKVLGKIEKQQDEEEQRDFSPGSNDYKGEENQRIFSEEISSKTFFKPKTNPHKLLLHNKKHVTVEEYERKLRSEYLEIHGSSNWAKKPKDDNEIKPSNTNLSTQTNVKFTRKMKKTNINYKQLKNLNFKNQHTSRVTSIDYFREGNIVLTSSIDQRLCLFKADNAENELIHSLYMSKYPIISAYFSPNSDKIFFNSAFNNFYCFDMNSEKLTKTTIKSFDKKDILVSSQISPDGNKICFFDRKGSIYTYDTQTFMPICELKSSRPILSLCFAQDGDALVTAASKTDIISVWDMRYARLRANLRDVTQFSNSAVAISPKERLLAIGSESGIVNLHSLDQKVLEYEKNVKLDASKTFNNLVSKCTQISFSKKTNLMVFSSPYADNSIKLVNVSSKTVYSNFLPTETARATVCTFSPAGNVLSIGNSTGAVKMYSFLDL